jgi:hypothetical protein
MKVLDRIHTEGGKVVQAMARETLGSLVKSKEEPDALDWRVPLDMTINSIGYALDDLQSVIERGGRDVEYLRLTDNQAILQSRLTKFMLICSVLAGTTTTVPSRTNHQHSNTEQGAFDDRCIFHHMGGEACTTRCRDPRDCSARRLPSTLQAAE